MTVLMACCNKARISYVVKVERPHFWSIRSRLEKFSNPKVDSLWILQRYLETPSGSWKQNTVRVIQRFIILILSLVPVSFNDSFYMLVTYNFPRSKCDCLYRRRMGARDWRVMRRINWRSHKNGDTYLLLKENDFNKMTDMNCSLLIAENLSFRMILNLHASILRIKVGFSITTSQSPWTIGRRGNFLKFRNSGPHDCNGLMWSMLSCNLFSFSLIVKERVTFQ